MEWILASASPRRKELLKEIIPTFSVIPSTAEEISEGYASPKELVMGLAKQKAWDIALRSMAKGKCILGADTVVAINGRVLGKPKDETEAFLMLSMLSGRTHEVYTGVCMLFPEGDGFVEKVDVDCTKVQFFPLKGEEIHAYIQTGSPMDKAGAYGIQDGGLVEKIEGSLSNVIGLPVELCKKMLERK